MEIAYFDYFLHLLIADDRKDELAHQDLIEGRVLN
jgi:hypothetical protein